MRRIDLYKDEYIEYTSWIYIYIAIHFPLILFWTSPIFRFKIFIGCQKRCRMVWAT